MIKSKTNPIYVAIAIDVVNELIEMIYNKKNKDTNTFYYINYLNYVIKVIYTILYKYDCLTNTEITSRLNRVFDIMSKTNEMNENNFRIMVFDTILDGDEISNSNEYHKSIESLQYVLNLPNIMHCMT